MQISLLLMQQIAQLFLILLMGYAVVKTGLLKASDSKVLSVVFVYLVMPCVVLNAFQIKDTPEIRTGLLLFHGHRRWNARCISASECAVPQSSQAGRRGAGQYHLQQCRRAGHSHRAGPAGEEYVVYSCAFVIVQLVLLWTHASACLQGSARLEWRKLLTNVNLIAIAAGALLYLLHISLPAPITSTLSSVGNMIGPMGMLLAGMAIAEVPLKKVFCTPRNYLPVFLRLLGVPLVIVLLLWAVHASLWIPDGKSILMTVYFSAITPACSKNTSPPHPSTPEAFPSHSPFFLTPLPPFPTPPLMMMVFFFAALKYEKRPSGIAAGLPLQLQGCVSMKLKQFIQQETVLTAAAVLAVVSAFFVPPDAQYLGYIDLRTLAILFSLMTVMAGLRRQGFLMDWAGHCCPVPTAPFS